jgi:hypothetical protein
MRDLYKDYILVAITDERIYTVSHYIWQSELVGGYIVNHEERTELLQSEEAKRDRMWDPAERWRMIQEMIDWADAQKPVPRNSKEGCPAAQRKWMEEMK